MTTARPSGIAATPRETAICILKLEIVHENLSYEILYLQIVDCALGPSSMSIIVEMLNIDNPYKNTNDHDNLR